MPSIIVSDAFTMKPTAEIPMKGRNADSIMKDFKAVSGKLDVNKLTSNQLMMCEKETLVDFIEKLKEEKEELKEMNHHQE